MYESHLSYYLYGFAVIFFTVEKAFPMQSHVTCSCAELILEPVLSHLFALSFINLEFCTECL